MSQIRTTAGRSAAPAAASQPSDDASHIAVIGLACRFPGAGDADAFWRNLLDGRDSITRLPGAEGVAARGILEDTDWFDAPFFGVSPLEAQIINPQHRVFLECAVEALENAGYDPARHPGSIGVYAGCGENEYAQFVKKWRAQSSSVSDWQIRLANGADFLCNRVAHKLGLRGPTVTVQAACATSLVAVHQAIRGLLNGDCDLALAGGVTVRVPSWADSSGDVGIEAPDGVCRAFDAQARGLVGGDGAGAVVLKRLVDARVDGDRVDAVIRGSATNNDGGGGLGFTAPAVDGQAAVIESAQRAAGVDARSCTYVEAHGTGTPLGDPVEIAALTKAFRRSTDARGFCWIGSVKTNIGHTDAAAGMAGLIKTVLALKHGVIPPSLHFTAPNPEIDWESSPFRVITGPLEWPREAGPRRAGVSSFGVGGTNAHVVLEEAPRPREADPYPHSWQLLPLSAKTPGALTAVVDRLAEHVRTYPGTPLAELAWTLQTGRREHPCRSFALVRTTADAERVLAGHSPDRLVTAPVQTRSRPLTFRFPAEDSRVEPRICARLYESEPVFRRAWDECGARTVFRASAASARAGDGAVAGDATAATGAVTPWPDEYGAAALAAFAARYAAARLWARWGLAPDAVLGEGTGTLVAAAVAGVFSVAEAGRLAVEAAGGAPEERLEELIRRMGPHTPAIPLYSARGAKRTTRGEATDPAYWAAWLRRPPADDPQPRLPRASDPLVLDITAGHLPTGEQALLRAVGELWLSGARVDWAAIHAGARPRRVALPTYPFERQRYTVTADASGRRPSGVEHAAAAQARPLSEPARPLSGAATVDTVAALFAELLGLPEVEPDESFFDLGGDSLIATRFVARAREFFSAELVPRTLFEAPTAAELAALIDERITAGRSE